MSRKFLTSSRFNVAAIPPPWIVDLFVLAAVEVGSGKALNLAGGYGGQFDTNSGEHQQRYRCQQREHPTFTPMSS